MREPSQDENLPSATFAPNSHAHQGEGFPAASPYYTHSKEEGNKNDGQFKIKLKLK